MFKDPKTDAVPVIDYVDDDPSSLSAELPDAGALEPDATIDDDPLLHRRCLLLRAAR